MWQKDSKRKNHGKFSKSKVSKAAKQSSVTMTDEGPFEDYLETSTDPGVLSCASCGTPLQEESPDKPGFWRDPAKIDRSHQKGGRKDSALASAMDKYMVEQLRQLDGEDLELKKKTKVRDTRPTCDRCRGIIHHNDWDVTKADFVTVDEVMEEIPDHANVVHVVSALDFPLSVSREVAESRDPEKMWYIVTKADAFFNSKSQLERTGLPYFRDSLRELVGAIPEHVLLCSGKLGWDTESMLAKLPPRGKVYFVGGVNSGKSTLIKTLLYRDDKSLKSSDKYGPGISAVPGFTADHMDFHMKSTSAVIVDTPGFSPPGKGIYEWLQDEDVREVSKVVRYSSPEPKSHQLRSPEIIGRKNFTGSSVYGVGGLLYVQPTPDAVLRVLPALPGKELKCKDISRAVELSDERPESMSPQHWLTRKEAAHNLARYVIPPFYGKIDVVLKGVGFLSLVPTSKPDPEHLFQVYVPKGVDVVVRESIYNYIYRTPGPRDETGNKLRKRNIVRRGNLRLRSVPKNKLIFTKLYEVPFDATNEEAFSAVQGTPEPFMDKLQEKYPNTYWRMPDLP